MKTDIKLDANIDTGEGEMRAFQGISNDGTPPLEV